MTPSIGRIVIYQLPDEDLPAIVLRVRTQGDGVPKCDLQVFGLTPGLRTGVSEGAAIDTWKWPPRVP